MQILPDRRRATDIGVSVSDLASTVSALVGGNVVGKFSSEGRRIDMRMRLLASERSRPEDLGQIRLRAQNGEMIPLSLLVTQRETAVLQSINRLDRERSRERRRQLPRYLAILRTEEQHREHFEPLPLAL